MRNDLKPTTRHASPTWLIRDDDRKLGPAVMSTDNAHCKSPTRSPSRNTEERSEQSPPLRAPNRCSKRPRRHRMRQASLTCFFPRDDLCRTARGTTALRAEAIRRKRSFELIPGVAPIRLGMSASDETCICSYCANRQGKMEVARFFLQPPLIQRFTAAARTSNWWPKYTHVGAATNGFDTEADHDEPFGTTDFIEQVGPFGTTDPKRTMLLGAWVAENRKSDWRQLPRRSIWYGDWS